MDPLAEILEAAGIPPEHPTRVLAERDGHSVVTDCIIDEAWTLSSRAIDLLAASGLSLAHWQRELLYEWSTVKPKRLVDITAC